MSSTEYTNKCDVRYFFSLSDEIKTKKMSTQESKNRKFEKVREKERVILIFI